MPEFHNRLWATSGLDDFNNLDWHVASSDRSFMDHNLAGEIHQLPQQRRQLIFQVRRQIAEGTYETKEKLDLALDRMLLDLDEDFNDLDELFDL